jgi:hypothetical protein
MEHWQGHVSPGYSGYNPSAAANPLHRGPSAPGIGAAGSFSALVLHSQIIIILLGLPRQNDVGFRGTQLPEIF